MRRLVVFVLSGVLALALIPSVAGAAPVARDSVRGTATHLGADPPFPPITVRIRASSNPDGSDPRGIVSVVVPAVGQRYRGRVTCLEVNGTQATIGIRIVQSNDPSMIGKGALWNVIDNGPSGDQIAGFPMTDTPPTECPPLSFSVPVVSGDYAVVSASP